MPNRPQWLNKSCTNTLSPTNTKNAAAVCVIVYALFTHHHGKNNGRLGGLDDPEHNQTGELDDGKEVHLPQWYVS